MTIDYSMLESGQEICRECVSLDADSVAKYTDAVGDCSQLTSGDNAVLAPPMAIAALALGAAINALQIPGGTIHAAQDLDFKKAVAVGAVLECTATVGQNSVRRGWRFLVVNMTAAEQEGDVVMQAKSTIMLPV